ncbi:MAG: HU family DNA-binding protein [Gloeocapsa sp. UFS-A4-WI-NPMV-4B04]|jgi:DNA-binding protein HU-beta|nr:HU family DNA-binding protein [Gloeocapsa sp. UFS-A4-WI-NPMV-4B04]
MNKGELIDAMPLAVREATIAQKTDVTKKQADAIVTAMVDKIVEGVAAGDKISLVGFGNFEVRDACGGSLCDHRQAREGRNPKTGEKMQIAASRVPAFAPGKAFKERVAGK